MNFLSKLLLLISMYGLSVSARVFSEGDVILGGLFDIFEPDSDGSCPEQNGKVDLSSVMQMEAIKWYLDKLYEEGGLKLKIGLDARATCGDQQLASEHAIQYLQQSLEYQSTETTNNDSKPYLIGVMGPEHSDEARTVSRILSSVAPDDHLVQLGYSTTAVELGDKILYPNLYRFIPDDEIQIEVMLQTLQALSWNRFSIIYENNLYGDSGAKKLQQVGESQGLCIVSKYKIDIEDGINTNQIINAINDIITNSTTGIVYFGGASTASRLFDILDNDNVQQAPIVLVSEGINMNNWAYRRATGQYINDAMGSLAVTPLYRQVTEFSDYWKGIFADRNLFLNKSTDNPWLKEVYKAIEPSCDSITCEFVPIDLDIFNAYFSRQPLFLQYAIFAVHSLAKVVNTLHGEHCGTNVGFCTAFGDIRPGDIVAKFEGLSVDFQTDFSWRPNSLADGTTFAITSSGGIIFSPGTPVYQLYNVQKASGTMLDLIKIGDYIDGSLTDITSNLRDYTSSGEERRWPDVRKAQCPVDRKCWKCLPMTSLHESALFDPGDAYIVGVNAIFEYSADGDGCGNVFTTNTYQTVEAMRFAISQINSNTIEYKSVFTNLKIGYIGLSSCNNGAVIQRKIYDLFQNGLLLSNGTRLSVKDKVVGFIGNTGSSLSIAVAEVLSRLHHVQISYASTSPLLSDRTRYPYFLRVVTPDNYQAKAMVTIMEKLNATYVQLVYSKGAYGEGGKTKILESIEKKNICVLEPIEVTDTNMNSVYGQLKKYPEAKLVVVFVRSHMVPILFTQLQQQMTPGEFQFIGSESWAKNSFVLENDFKHLTLGSLTLVLEMYQDRSLKEHILGVQPQPFVFNPWATLYLQKQQNCYFEFSFDKTTPGLCPAEPDSGLSLDTWSTSAYVSTLSLLLGAYKHFEKTCGNTSTELCKQFHTNRTKLVEEIKTVRLDLEGKGDEIKVFNNNGDGSIGYRVYNVRKNPDSPQTLEYKEVGRFPLEGEFTFNTNDIVSTQKSVCPNPDACKECLPKDTTTTTPPPDDSYVQ